MTDLSPKSHRDVRRGFYYMDKAKEEFTLFVENKKEVHIMEFLKVENLYKVYGRDENQVIALDDVSLTIDKGEFTAIIGSSGSGKSTLLHAIAGEIGRASCRDRVSAVV